MTMSDDFRGEGIALKRELNKLSSDRNTITLSIFNYFISMFVNAEREKMDPEEYYNRCMEWKARIDPYSKIVVTEDMLGEDGLRKVAFVLPPQFSKVNMLNEGNTKAAEIVTFFGNAIARNDPLRTDTEEAVFLITKAVDLSQNATRERHESAIEEYASIMEDLRDLLSTPADADSEDSSAIDTSIFCWE